MKITVIGGANIDISGRSNAPLVAEDSNPAHVNLSPGGVGRNIAENLVRLGADVSFISAIGDDGFSRLMEGYFNEAGMDTAHLIRRRGIHTGLYLALFEPAGKFFIAVNDMEAVESITPADIDAAGGLLVHSDLVVLDANLRPETLEAALAAAGNVPVMADSVSEAKAERLKAILPGLSILKANRAEAEVLAGFSFDTDNALRKGCRKLLDAGPKQLYITLGKQGACSAVRGHAGECVLFMQPVLPGALVNVNGAGDAFAAGAAYSYCLGYTVEANGLFGAACAAITVECEDGVSKNLTRAAAVDRMAAVLRSNTDTN
ncbi:kinase, PfkB family [Treponema primitia ZAS-2]|uniref:Kinase, PfkB family n=1 Tax=Treponema primitia (strain ATCC BAA-887 / DSM 12427 / ZAS-2) TaxID=545694 RepID=F5YQ88_TREPZ|nr:carbohydrate kinase family protein [Treponema primitia]AEF83687.1 kinase, PfkB family [Treponema primitia ZAS-2]